MLFPVPMMPTFIGTANSLQIDVSTLPRSDQVMLSQGAQSTGMGGAMLSDMKTVSYYMTGGANMPQIMSSPTAQGGTGQGLLRREVPRASNVAAGANAGSSSGNLALPEPLAPEVIDIAFQYSDGVNLYPTWDSRQHNSLPKLVKITVTFLAGNMNPSRDDLPNGSNPKPTVKYSLAVSPAAWRPVPAWLTAMMSSAASGGTASGTGGTSTGGTMSGAGTF
jgi:hypothetical protein